MGPQSWVCVSSIRYDEGQITLYDSLYNNIIATEVEEQQVKSLPGERECQILIAPVQQQGNASDCVVFAIAFATCLVNSIDPITVDFDISKMRPNLLSCLKSGYMYIYSQLFSSH